MVSELSARLLAGRGDSPSQSSSRKEGGGSRRNSNTSPQQYKRTASGAVKTEVNTMMTATGINNNNNNNRVESSVSGYSADKEGTSSVLSPPVLSIDLHGRETKKKNNSSSTTSSTTSSRDARDCPKRKKTQELLFAASSVKRDLERAGMPYKKMKKNVEEVQPSDDICINLKGVRLIHSCDVESPLISSNISKNTTVAEYEALLHAVSDSYPSSVGLKSFEPSQTPRDGSSDSTSSVSDTESDSGSDNVNNGSNHILFLPSLVEDAFDHTKAKKSKVSEPISQCNVISCASNATTMTESLQLSSEARCATNNKPVAPMTKIGGRKIPHKFIHITFPSFCSYSFHGLFFPFSF
jgi:hypothetical protein